MNQKPQLQKTIKVMRTFFLVVFISFIEFGCTQKDYIEQDELLKNIEKSISYEKATNHEYLFKQLSPNKNGVLEYYFTYLGNVSIKTKGEVRFVHTKILSGLYEDSKRANTRIALYKANIRIGSYFISGSFDSIPVLSDGILTFKHNSTLDCNLTSKINFNDSIPSNIFIKCLDDGKNTFGDLYMFTKEE